MNPELSTSFSTCPPVLPPAPIIDGKSTHVWEHGNVRVKALATWVQLPQLPSPVDLFEKTDGTDDADKPGAAPETEEKEPLKAPVPALKKGDAAGMAAAGELQTIKELKAKVSSELKSIRVLKTKINEGLAAGEKSKKKKVLMDEGEVKSEELQKHVKSAEKKVLKEMDELKTKSMKKVLKQKGAGAGDVKSKKKVLKQKGMKSKTKVLKDKGKVKSKTQVLKPKQGCKHRRREV